MKKQTFTRYRLINEKNNNIVYEIILNDTIDHDQKLSEEKSRISSEKALPYMKLFWEVSP